MLELTLPWENANKRLQLKYHRFQEQEPRRKMEQEGVQVVLITQALVGKLEVFPRVLLTQAQS